MNPKDGKAGSPVEPVPPEKPEDADLADPGEVDKVKAEQIKKKEGKYGSEKVTPFKPAGEEDEEDEEKHWIEIELVDEEDNPVPGEKYKVTMPDGSVAQGTLDYNGFVHIGGIKDPGTCKITFPNLDKDAWEPA